MGCISYSLVSAIILKLNIFSNKQTFYIYIYIYIYLTIIKIKIVKNNTISLKFKNHNF